MKLFKRLEQYRVITLSVTMKAGYRELEKNMIQHYRPLLNKQYKTAING